MTTFNKRVSALLSTTVLTSILVGSASAPAVSQSADVQLEEITVTARKRPERVWDIPFSVDVQAQPQLDEKRVTDAPSALRDVSGAGITTFGDKSNSFIIMRGVAPILTPLSPDDSSVLTFVDGAPLPMGASNSSYLDLQRVEVMKGPQSTLFGRNTSGGAINLIPALPTFTPEGYLRGEYGTGNFHRVEGVVSGPIIPGKLAGRIALRRNGADGYIDNVFGPTLGGEGIWTGRASLLFTPTDRTTWTVSASHEDSRNTPVYYQLAGLGYAGQFRPLDNSKINNFTSKFEHSFDSFTFTSQTSYATFKNKNEYQYGDAFLLSAAYATFGLVLPPSFYADPAQNFNVWNRNESRFTQEFRVTSQPNAPISWLLGAVYYEDKADYFNSADQFGLVTGSPLSSGTRTYKLDTKGQALFGEATFPVFERLKWSIGARGAHESKSFEGQYFGGPFTAVGALPYFYEEGSRSYSFWTGRTGLTYEWSSQFMSFANVSRGYKTGGFGVYNTGAPLGVAREPYGSATVMTYEVGSRASLLDNRLRINAAFFFNDVKDEQILAYAPQLGNAVLSLNVDTQSKGFEADATFQITPHWEVSGGFAYTNAKMLNVAAQVIALQPGIQDGNRLPNVPEWTAKAALGYRAPASSWGLGGALADSNIVGRVGYNYIGSRYTDAANFGGLEPVHLVSARLGIDWGRGEAYIFGENLLDQKYMTLNQPFTFPPTVFGVSYARGAVVGVGTSVRF
jgi:iron complex outermembrane receptor protein